MSGLERFRQEKDNFFKHDSNSPLTPEQKNLFSHLDYFPEEPALRLELPLELLEKPEVITMLTSTGDQRDYQHQGQVRFIVQDQSAILQVYMDGYGGWFLPFVDTTAPELTYGAGRYLEPEEVRPGFLLVDFNLAYNPYCAYNDRWSCPIPPRANRIKIRIEAGEKKFHK